LKHPEIDFARFGKSLVKMLITGRLLDNVTAYPNRLQEETFICKTVLLLEIRLYNLENGRK
jgi:hypothetical protein